MSKYSPADIANYVAKTENAKNNALWSIERAYLLNEGAPAAFILLTCLIDFLGTLYAGRESNEKTFRGFVSDFFMKQTYDGVRYDDKELYSSLRNKLVHNYSIWRGRYVLTHRHPEMHLKPHGSKATILNLEDFYKDVKQAADDYFARVKQETTLQHKLSDRISTVGTIEDVEVWAEDNRMESQPMSSESSNADLQIVGEMASRWQLETLDLSVLRRQMGDDLLRAFVRCFVHADRLTSLAHFGRLNGDAEVPEIASKRNYLTAFWFTVGTFRELAIALRQLRSVLAKRGWLGADMGPLHRLREVEDRWENDPFYRAVRNTQAFHVDDEIIAKGLDILCTRNQPVTIVEGGGTSDYNSSATLGAHALLLGLGATERQIETLLQAVYRDTRIYLALDEVFFAVLKKLGIRLSSKPWSEGQRIWEV